MTGSVVVYKGKRGKVFRLKFRDADGRQVMETLGAERDGWTEKKAQSELRERLVRVERKGWRKPTPLKFGDYVETWFEESERKRQWKPLTVKAYRTVLERLRGHFGPMALATIRPRDVAGYVREASREYGPSTVNRDLSVLHDALGSAVREELIETNPAARAERPRIPKNRWRILEPVEVAEVARAFVDPQHRLVFVVLCLTGVRRFELMALRWRDIDFVDCVLRVRESKSEEGERSIALGPELMEELWQHRRRSSFYGDDERGVLQPARRPPSRRRLPQGIQGGARRCRDRGSDPTVPRPPARVSDKRRRQRRGRDRSHGPRRAPKHEDDAGVSPSCWHRLP